MPKISNVVVKVYTEKISEGYKVEVFYNQKNGFYIVVPPQFKQACAHLTDEDRKEYKVETFYKNSRERFKANPEGDYITTSDTEVGVIQNARKLFTKLALSAITERKVILIFYDSRKTSRNHAHTDGFEPMGLELGLTFCVETSVAGGDPVYYEYTEYEASGEKQVNKRQIRVWNSSCTIIDDTPENKEFVTTLYKALAELVNKMDKFTASKENFLQLIASRQKLLA